MIGKNKSKRKEKSMQQIDNIIDMPLFEFIQPQGGITFTEPNYILSGDGYIKVIHIYQLPKDLNDHWMDNIFNIDNTIATADVFTKDVTEVKKNINRSLQEQYSREKNATDFAEVYDARKRQAELQEMYNELSSMGEVVKMMHFRIFVPGRNLFALEEKVEQIMKKLESDTFMPTILLNECKREWQSLYKTYTKQHKEPFYIKGLPLTSEQIAIGNPFHYSELLDENGTLLGFTPCGGLVSFDIWEKSAHRNYYNALACGDLGAGKSTFLKKLFVANAADGNYVRVFDASGEFTQLVKEFGGKIIKCNGVDGILNPLEILNAGDDDFTSYARHITKFGTFFRCINPDAEDKVVIDLQNELRMFYEKLGLTPSEDRRITGLPASSYPTLADFWNYCKQEIEDITSSDIEKGLEFEQLKIRLYSLNDIERVLNNLVTSYGNMFNGHTSIDNIVDERIVSFDISDIRNLNNIFAAQMYNMTTLNWDNAVQIGSVMKDKYEAGEITAEEVTKFLILIDESHEWINTKMPVILEIMGKYLREARKYFAGMVFASQSVRDFNPEGEGSEHMDLLKTFFELTQYKFMFRQSSSSLPLLNSIFNNELSFSQIKQIPYLGQGEAILSIAGDRSIRFNVWRSEIYEKPLFAGGR